MLQRQRHGAFVLRSQGGKQPHVENAQKADDAGQKNHDDQQHGNKSSMAFRGIGGADPVGIRIPGLTMFGVVEFHKNLAGRMI